MTTTNEQPQTKRGFAALSPERRREISSSGGKAAHAMGKRHSWTTEEAQAAGRKGGAVSKRRYGKR